jgi:hypothetical protein
MGNVENEVELQDLHKSELEDFVVCQAGVVTQSLRTFFVDSQFQLFMLSLFFTAEMAKTVWYE